MAHLWSANIPAGGTEFSSGATFAFNASGGDISGPKMTAKGNG
ncbi:hypothetical protein [Oceaniglobus trochenteri]|nr:hypothetical protein [Oceaniglobus trochenteri]